MATITLGAASAVKTISGNSPQVLMYPEAASQAYKKGELVYLVDGKITEVGDNPSVILGMAAQDASGTTNTSQAVYIANEDTIFEFNKVTNAGGSGGAGTAGVTAVTDVGKTFNIYRDTTNNITHAGLYAFGGNERLMCLDLSDKDTVGDTGGRLLCMVHGRYRQLFSTS
jgi:hypothetical protein